MGSARTVRQKLVMLGTFAVGKTSLVRRFVSDVFSDQYLTTVGVKVEKRVVHIDDTEVSMLLWDLHGEDDFQKIRTSYLRGSGGYLLVADGTRGHTLESARALQREAVAALGESVPFALLVNKRDLRDRWEVEDGQLEELRRSGWVVVETSAKTGEGVLEAFDAIARRILGAAAR